MAGQEGICFRALRWPESCSRGLPDAQVTFVGTAAGIESRVVPREGFALDVIRSAGLKGKSLPSLLRGLGAAAGERHRRMAGALAPASVGVIGVGGYSSGPVVGLAALRGIPTLLMEQNAVPGLTNRLLASRGERGSSDLRRECRGVRRESIRRGQSGQAGVLW